MMFQRKLFQFSAKTQVRRSVAAALLSTSALAMVSIDVAQAQVLEEIVVTAQRRETALQTTPIAITAYSGETLAENKIFNVTDLANSVPAFSLTAGTPLDVELNIRGITNTRLDAPSADPSVGTFVDGVYIGRTGDLNYDFYDLERIEVIRGPQGVLLGKNVVGGALSVITAKPSFDPSAKITLGYGNYDSVLTSGYMTGALTDTIAGRFSFQTRNRDGFAYDLLNDRELENLNSIQARGQLLFTPEGSDLEVLLGMDYTKDSNNGINVAAVEGGTPGCETSYLRSNCSRPWSNLRRFLGLTDPRVSMPSAAPYSNLPAPKQQFMRRENTALRLDIERQFDGFAFNSLTAYRAGFGTQYYDQTGIGPQALGRSVPRWLQYVAFVTTTKPAGNGSNGQLLFTSNVDEKTKVRNFSQEFRLTSTNEESRFDWIVGAYYNRDNVDKTDHFIAENFLGSLFVGAPTGGPLASLSGETVWVNDGLNESYAAFGQIGFDITDKLKITAGIRYTEDKKGGTVSGTATATGDFFNPGDTVALTPLAGTFTRGTGYTTAYGEKWDKLTPQAILSYTPNDDLFFYATYAKGFKGGGYDDDPTSAVAARISFDPEVVNNYEAGFKASFLDRRARLNASVFTMDYTDLQVTQTNAACLCNLTDNAASAKIKGVEVESEFAITDGLRLLASGSYVDPEYKDFIETAINPATGQRLVSSGNRLQRTPKTQFSIGADLTTSLGNWEDALNFRVDYTYQSNLFWATDNLAREPGYGLLDLRVGLAPVDKNWQIAAYGKNVTNKLFRTNVIPFFGEEASQFSAPRTYGVDVTWKF